MKRIQQSTAGMLVVWLMAITGSANAAEVPVPAEAINDDVPVAVWVDLEALNMDAIFASVQSIADALPDDMADSREPMVAGFQDDLDNMKQAIATLRDAGARGMLLVMSASDMEQQQAMALLYTKEGTSVESIQQAVNQVAEEGQDAQVETYSGSWMRMVEVDGVEIRDGDEANAEAFRELLSTSGDAPIRVALRLTDNIKQQITAQADGDPMMAGFAGALESLNTGWMTVEFGEQPEIQNRLNFADAEAAAEFNAAWEGMLMMGEALVMGQLGQMQDAPGPESVQRLFESLKMEQDEETLSLTLGDQFIGQAAEFVPVAMGMAMLMMMGDAMQGTDGMQENGGEWEQQQWEEPTQEPTEEPAGETTDEPAGQI